MRRAIGIIRQSKGREDSLSPAEQRQRIEGLCEREGLSLVEVHEEIDVSGGTPLAKRDGLRAAVEAVEARSASVVVVAYFDRLFRSLTVQAEVIERVELAGGNILSADVGTVSASNAGTWMSSTAIGMASEFYRRTIKERSGEAQRIAVEEGRPPFGTFPPGYVRGGEGRLEVVEDLRPAVIRAFELRRDGETIDAVRDYLREQGIIRSYRGVQSMLSSTLYLGEIHFGDLVNLEAHEPIIDRDLWGAVQAVSVKRGPKNKSDRLLARLGVLRCGTCGAKLSVGFQTSKGRRYPFYRCNPTSDCPNRVTIGAKMVEDFIVKAAKDRHRDLVGRASLDAQARAAEEAAIKAQANLDAAIRAFAGLETEAAAVERMRELRDARDSAVELADRLRGSSSVRTVTMEDWDLFNLEEQRDIIRLTFDSVRVAPGRGLDRVSVKFAGE